MSAYAVFNRGFQNIMGSVDVENLVAQYAGGAGAMAMNHNQVQHDIIDNDREEAAMQRDAGNANDLEEEGVGQAQQPQQNNRSRKSSKKARRKQKMEQRREMQRQRDAAAAMGFGAGDIGDINDARAMNLLVEEQAAAALREDN